MGRALGGLILIALGVSWLIGFDLFHLIFPLILILLGVALLMKKDRVGQYINAAPYADGKETVKEESNKIDEVYVFSGTRKRIQSSAFSGGRVVAVFGGADLDLRDIKVGAGKTVELELVAVLGGINLQVPENWSVSSSGMTAVLGGFNNGAHNDSEKAVKVHVRGASVLGGIEIRY